MTALAFEVRQLRLGLHELLSALRSEVASSVREPTIARLGPLGLWQILRAGRRWLKASIGRSISGEAPQQRH